MSFEEIVPNEHLRHARYLKGWTQSDLASALDTDFETVSRWERGIAVPGLFYREKLCGLFEKTAEELGLHVPFDEQLTPFPLVFLTSAYADAEQTFVSHLKEHLRARGITIWSSRMVRRHGAENKRKALQEAIRAAQVILLVISPEARSSRYVQDTLQLANIYKRPICALWIDGENWQECVPKACDQLYAQFDARQRRDEALLDEIVETLEVACHVSNESPASVPPSNQSPETLETPGKPRNPYKGLNAFRAEDRHDYFGRDTLLDELTAALDIALNDQQHARLLAVVGASGSGKSSVVMAGLLPRLQAGSLPGSKEWVYLDPIVPGGHPCTSLASASVILSGAKNPLVGFSLAAIREELEHDSYSLHVLLNKLVMTLQDHSVRPASDSSLRSTEFTLERGEGFHSAQNDDPTTSDSSRERSETRVVLFIDQFEEVFAQTIAEEERQHFIDLLVNAVTQPQGPVIVILALRADFYDRTMHYPELCQLIEAHHKLVLPMEIPALRSVIEKPAALPDVQLTFEGDLVSDLLFEVHGQVGALPLLQFALDHLYQRRSDHLLTLQAYQEIGGVKGALAKWAEATYAALPSEEHRRLARALFLRLIDPGDTEQDTRRRRAALTELSLPDPEKTTIIQEVASAFVAARLLTTNEIAGTTTVEVSHEALIREWIRLSDWLREAREDIRLQQVISKDVSTWEQRGKPRDRLYRGSQLTEARTWARRNIPATREVAFLRASTVYRMRHLLNLTALVLLLVCTTGLATRLLLAQASMLPGASLTTVTTLQEDGPGSLRQALASARPGSTITFDPSLRGTIMLASDDLNISQHLAIRGPGAGILAISTGNSLHRIHVFKGISVSISGLSFKNSTDDDVGFIYNSGTLTLINSTITGNRTYSTLGGADGGGIYNDGTLNLINSTVSDNTAGAADNYGASIGGGIYNVGTLTLTNSTVSGNRAGIGGGIYTFGALTLTNSTIAENMATGEEYSYGGGIAIEKGQADLTFCTIADNTSLRGGGIAIQTAYLDSSQTTMRNSLVAGNHAITDPGVSGKLVSDGYNLVQNFSDTLFVSPLKRSLSGVSANTFPNLGIDSALRNNGGPTRTYALLPGSPTIDQIPPAACHPRGISTDQRGVKRPQGPACDIGAYEYVPSQ